MKITFLNDFYTPHLIGGTETALQHLLSGLLQRGHEVSIITARIGKLPSEEILKGVRIIRIGQFPTFWLSLRKASGTAPSKPSPRLLREFVESIRRLSPDVLHFHNLWLLGPKLMEITGVRKGITVHDYWPFCLRRSMVRVGGSLCPGPAPIACRLCRLRAPASLGSLDLIQIEHDRQSISKLLQDCDFCLAASKYVAEQISRINGVPTKVIRYGISTSVDSKHDVPREGFVLFAGRGTSLKGINLLFDVFSRADMRAYRLLVASDVRVPKQTNIQVLGWQPHEAVLELMRKSACVVVPSLWPEPFGLVALEAQSVGTPVIVSRIGGLPEQVEENKTGILVPPGDKDALARAIHTCCEDPTIQINAQKYGPELVRSQFSLDRAVKESEEVYASKS